MKEKATFQQESQYLQKRLAAINDRMTEIKDLKDEVISVKDAIDNNNQETTESLTNNLTFYHSVLTDKVSTSSNHPMEFNKLLTSFESIQDSDFDLLTLSQLTDVSIEDSVGKNLIEL